MKIRNISQKIYEVKSSDILKNLLNEEKLNSSNNNTLNNSNNLTFNNSFNDEKSFYLIKNNKNIYILTLTIEDDTLNFKIIENLLNKKEEIISIYVSKNKLYFKTKRNNIIIINKADKILKEAQNNIKGIIQSKKINKIACGLEHILFLTFGGMLYSCGSNLKSQLGYETSKESDVLSEKLIMNLLEYNIEDIYCGGYFNIAIGKEREDNDSSNEKNSLIFSWGDNTYGNCGVNPSEKEIKVPHIINNIYPDNVKEISCGLNHTVILNKNNTIIIFGDNQYNQCSFTKDSNNNSIKSSNYFINYDYFINKTENIIKVKTSSNSTMLLTNKGTLLVFGKFYDNNKKLFKIENVNEDLINNLNFIFTDNYLLFINNNINNQKSEIELTELFSEIKEIKLNEDFSANIILQSSLKGKNDANNNNNIFSIKNDNDISFDDFLIDNNTKLTNMTDISNESLYELRSYINLIEISLSPNYDDSEISFRPSNLKKKSKEEEELHRRLVQENRVQYQQILRQRQQMERELMKEKELKEENEEKKSNYWLKEIIPNWNIMKSNKNFVNYFYEGIPKTIRGKIWLLSVGNKFSITKDYYNIEVKKSIQLLIKEKNKSENKNEESDVENDKLYSKYIIKTTNKEKSINLIECDIERTFSNLNLFKNNSSLSEDLREILRAFVVSRPDIGYVQGLSYIAAFLLLQMGKFQSFVCLMNIILNPNILPFYLLEEKGISQRIEIFNDIFLCNLPKLFEHFNSLEIKPEHYFFDWIMTIFTRNLNMDLSLRLWDVYMVEGIKCLYKVSIVILLHYEKKFLKMDFTEIFRSLKNLEKFNIEPDTFIESLRNVKFTDKIINKINKLTEDYLPVN